MSVRLIKIKFYTTSESACKEVILQVDSSTSDASINDKATAIANSYREIIAYSWENYKC